MCGNVWTAEIALLHWNAQWAEKCNELQYRVRENKTSLSVYMGIRGSCTWYKLNAIQFFNNKCISSHLSTLLSALLSPTLLSYFTPQFLDTFTLFKQSSPKKTSWRNFWQSGELSLLYISQQLNIHIFKQNKMELTQRTQQGKFKSCWQKSRHREFEWIQFPKPPPLSAELQKCLPSPSCQRVSKATRKPNMETALRLISQQHFQQFSKCKKHQ